MVGAEVAEAFEAAERGAAEWLLSSEIPDRFNVSLPLYDAPYRNKNGGVVTGRDGETSGIVAVQDDHSQPPRCRPDALEPSHLDGSSAPDCFHLSNVFRPFTTNVARRTMLLAPESRISSGGEIASRMGATSGTPKTGLTCRY